MNILTVGAAGVAAVLLAVWMKGVRGEYALYVVIAAQLFFLFYGIGRLKEILDIIRQMTDTSIPTAAILKMRFTSIVSHL